MLLPRLFLAIALVALLATHTRAEQATAQPVPPQPAQIINLGHVEIWAVPDFQPPPPPDPADIKAGKAAVVRSQPVSLDEARVSADFALVFPAWLPSPAMELTRIDILPLPATSGEVTLVYRDPIVDPRVAGPREVVIHQRRWTGTPRIFMPRLLEEGTIGGAPAVFWTLDLPAPATQARVVAREFVMFERGDLLITVDAAGLTRAELVRVAESLAEVP